jgi:dihydrofolate reductase
VENTLPPEVTQPLKLPDITLVAAVADNGVIGAEGAMPWHLPADLAHFKRITMTKPILMGRLTWDAIGKALPGRLNMVLTRNPKWRGHGAMRVESLDEALKIASTMETDELMVIGGAELYRQALPRARRIHLTRIHVEPWGDTLFPDLEPGEWKEVERSEYASDERNAFDMTFLTLERTR